MSSVRGKFGLFLLLQVLYFLMRKRERENHKKRKSLDCGEKMVRPKSWSCPASAYGDHEKKVSKMMRRNKRAKKCLKREIILVTSLSTQSLLLSSLVDPKKSKSRNRKRKKKF